MQVTFEFRAFCSDNLLTHTCRAVTKIKTITNIANILFTVALMITISNFNNKTDMEYITKILAIQRSNVFTKIFFFSQITI